MKIRFWILADRVTDFAAGKVVVCYDQRFMRDVEPEEEPGHGYCDWLEIEADIDEVRFGQFGLNVQRMAS